MTVYQFPKEHWKKIRTSNGIERMNREIKRRTRVAVLFPNKESALRLVTGVIIEIHEEWVTGKQYLDMSPLLNRELKKTNKLRGEKRKRSEFTEKWLLYLSFLFVDKVNRSVDILVCLCPYGELDGLTAVCRNKLDQDPFQGVMCLYSVTRIQLSVCWYTTVKAFGHAPKDFQRELSNDDLLI